MLPVPLVPDHQLLRVVGSGSGGQVWLARNALGTFRAIKIVYRQAFNHERPFEREFNGILKFEPVSRLHDGLVDILQVGSNVEAGYFYCVMELADDAINGPYIVPESYTPHTLTQYQRVAKRTPVMDCVRVGSAIASALGFLHKHGLTHRDVKPSNIIFVHGIPKLADTGLVADVSDTKSFVGTEGFIPPEGTGTAAADIYALGKILYELSTGNDRNAYPQLPTDLGTGLEDQALIQFNRIVLRACRSNPRQRYSTADEMLMALLGFQFKKAELQRDRNFRLAANVFGILGAVTVITVLTLFVKRLIWLLNNP